MSVPPLDPRAFRDALGHFATGVTIVTTRDVAGGDIGLTVNSFNSVSLDPPLVLWSLARNSRSLAAFQQAEHFAVHILAADQEALSNLFARRGMDKFAGLEVGRGVGDVPLLEGCAARFECRTAHRYEGGDHEIIVGEVLSFEQFDHPPLAYHRGRYVYAVGKPAPLPDTEAEPEASFSRDFLHYLLGWAHSAMLGRLVATMGAAALREDEYFVLNLLGVRDRRPLAELDRLLAHSGLHCTPALLQQLEQRGLVALLDEDGQRQVVLTTAGRAAHVQGLAIAKAIEEDALARIDYGEAQLLKALLRRVIRNIDGG